MSAQAFTRALEDGDLRRLRGMWAQLAPHLPQPESDEQAEVIMHHARTQAKAVRFKYRAYSHRWLRERGLPSGLPDTLRPKAERIYPIEVLAIGISVNFRSAWMKPAAAEVRGAMEHAVLDAQAEGRLADSAFVSERMAEAKRRTMKALFGRIS